MDQSRSAPEGLRRILGSRLRRLARIGPFAAASLVRTGVTCMGTGCRCHRGQKHLAWLLRRSREGKSQTVYVRQRKVREVSRWIRRYKRLKVLIREITDLNVQILKAEARRSREQDRKART